MSNVRFVHDIGGLADDLAQIAAGTKVKMVAVVRSDVAEGTRVAQDFAREASGRHGAAYYKRITGEMTGLLRGDFGPHDGGTPVGAGFRHGLGNTDLPKAADVIGPKLAKDAGDILDGAFWP